MVRLDNGQSVEEVLNRNKKIVKIGIITIKLNITEK